MVTARDSDLPGPRDDEHSAIRPKESQPPAPARQRRDRPSTQPPPTAIAELISRAQALLQTLPPGHPQLRLLKLGLLRRDETLLRGVLSAAENAKSRTSQSQ